MRADPSLTIQAVGMGKYVTLKYHCECTQRYVNSALGVEDSDSEDLPWSVRTNVPFANAKNVG